MSKNKPVFTLLALLMALSLVLAACSPAAPTAAAPAGDTGAQEEQPATSEEQITLSFWNGFNAHEVEILNQMIEKYWNPTHPNIKVVAEGEITEDVMLTAISGGDPPDVMMAAGPESVSLWAEQGAIQDLSDVAQPVEAQLEAELVPAGLDWSKYDGKYYALPFVNFNWGVYYNKALFKEAGLDPEKPPANLDELKEYARKLTKVDADGNITQLGWMPMTSEWSALNFVRASGGQFYDPETLAPTFNDPNIVKAFQWDLDLAKEFGLDKVIAFTTGFTEGDNPFLLGKAAMYIDGCWMVTFIKEYNPELDYGVAAIPYSDPAYANANNVGTNPIVVPVGSKHPKEAKEFALFFSMNKDMSREFSGLISNIPQVKSELGTFTDDPKTKFFADMSNAPTAGAWAPVAYSSQYLNEMVSAIGDMYNNGTDAQTALDKANEVVTEAAKPYME